MSLAIRPAGSVDIDRLIAIDPAAQVLESRREAIGDWVGAAQCHIALGDGRAAGYVVLTRHFFRSAFIEALMVAESDRRMGIGLALMHYCRSIVPAGEKLWTSTNQSNTPMQALLAGEGYVRCGIVEHIDEGDPELFYVLFPRS